MLRKIVKMNLCWFWDNKYQKVFFSLTYNRNDIINENKMNDKQNNINLNNCYGRSRKRQLKTIQRPLTSQFQTTFNPFSYANGHSIPLIAVKQNNRQQNDQTLQKIDRDSFFRPLAKGPVIARNMKLKNFFAQQSARYSKDKVYCERKTARSLKVNSLEVIQNKQYRNEEFPRLRRDVVKQKTRKEQFQRVYLHQKELFQGLLAKYGANFVVDENDFLSFMQEG